MQGLMFRDPKPLKVFEAPESRVIDFLGISDILTEKCS